MLSVTQILFLKFAVSKRQGKLPVLEASVTASVIFTGT